MERQGRAAAVVAGAGELLPLKETANGCKENKSKRRSRGCASSRGGGCARSQARLGTDLAGNKEMRRRTTRSPAIKFAGLAARNGGGAGGKERGEGGLFIGRKRQANNGLNGSQSSAGISTGNGVVAV